MCYADEAYCSIHPNREDDEYYQQLISKQMEWHQVFSLHGKTHYVNISFKKGLTLKQAEYVCDKCENEGIIGTE